MGSTASVDANRHRHDKAHEKGGVRGQLPQGFLPAARVKGFHGDRKCGRGDQHRPDRRDALPEPPADRNEADRRCVHAVLDDDSDAVGAHPADGAADHQGQPVPQSRR
jgi:hypothetical protein